MTMTSTSETTGTTARGRRIPLAILACAAAFLALVEGHSAHRSSGGHAAASIDSEGAGSHRHWRHADDVARQRREGGRDDASYSRARQTELNEIAPPRHGRHGRTLGEGSSDESGERGDAAFPPRSAAATRSRREGRMCFDDHVKRVDVREYQRSLLCEYALESPPWARDGIDLLPRNVTNVTCLSNGCRCHSNKHPGIYLCTQLTATINVYRVVGTAADGALRVEYNGTRPVNTGCACERSSFDEVKNRHQNLSESNS